MTRPAAARWAELQAGRGIPPEIRAAVDWDPFHHDPSRFLAPAVPVDTPSRSAGMALLGEPGSVLDVGCGGGDAAFAVAERATLITGVDQQPDMLELFRATAAQRRVPIRVVRGVWPDAAQAAGPADVVVCHHVLHNVVDLPPFLAALTGAARREVVVEMLDRHPLAWLDPLWERFYGLRRPEPATAEDAVAVLREAGIDPEVIRWERATPPRQDPAWVTRRLCLPPERVPEVAAALGTLDRPRTAATLRWR